MQNYRHIGANDGQDWPVSRANCTIPREITDITELYGFTLRIDEAMKPAATAFRDFDNSKLGALWEIIFQQFIYMCEALKRRLSMIVNSISGDLNESEVLQYYIEPILDQKKFVEDLKTSYCKTACCGYTFWVLILKSDNTEVVFDVQTIYDGIVKAALTYCKSIAGDNCSIIEGILEHTFRFGDEESQATEGREERLRKRQRKPEKLTIKDLQKHERWKLLAHKEILANIFDMMVQGQEWQTDRASEMMHKKSNITNSPELVNTMFNPYVAFYARPIGCVAAQSIFNIERVISKNKSNGTWTLRFPMRKYVMKIPLSLVSVENIINRKLLDYQLNSTYSLTRMLPIILGEVEQMIESGSNSESLKDDKKKRTSHSKAGWESKYEKFEEIIKYVADAGGIEREDDDYGNSDFSNSPSDSLNDEEYDRCKLAAMNLVCKGTLSGSKEDMLKQTISEMNKMEEMSELGALSYAFSNAKGIKELESKSRTYGMHNLLSSVVRKSGGRFTRLLQSQIVNCTTLWPDGTDTRDNNQDDYYEFISVYAILSAQNVAGRLAIESVSKRIELGLSPGGEINNPTEVKRKLLLCLKRHLLKEYILKCSSSNAYGISPYEKAFLSYQEKHRPFSLRVTHSNVDNSLGIFENQEIKFYAKMKSTLQIAENHRPLAVGIMAANDSTRATNDLHYNVVYSGAPHATGKSTVTDWIFRLLIEGTCISNAYNSARSDLTSERNLNGGTIINPEIAFTSLDDGDHKNGFGQRQKNLLTSCTSSGVRLQFDEVEKTYKAVHFKSSQQGSLLGNCNWSVRAKLSGPVKSRIHLIEVNESPDTQENILHSKATEKVFAVKLSPEEQELKDELSLKQLLTFHIERGILTGFLDDVTCDIGWIFCLVLHRLLKSKGINMGGIRTVQRIIIAARQNCIDDVQEKTWFHRHAKYNGVDISLDQLLEIDRKLALTTNHIVAAIGETYDNIINPLTDVVRNCIYKMFHMLGKGARFKRRVVNRPLNELQKLPEKDRDKTWIAFDYNYMRFGGYSDNSLTELSKSISKFSQSMGGVIVPPESVKCILKEWMDTKVNCHVYSKGGCDNPEVIYGEQGHEEECELTEVKPFKIGGTTARPLVEVTSTSVHFLYHYFGEENPKDSITILKETIVTILSCAHQMHGKFIFDNDKEFPFIRNVIEVTKNTSDLLTFQTLGLTKTELMKVVNNYHKRKGLNYDDEESWNKDANEGYNMDDWMFYENQCDVTSIGCDLNALSIKRRNEALCISEKPINGPFQSYDIFNGVVRDKHNIKNMSSKDKDAISFFDDTDYDNSDTGYFMGESLDDIEKAEDIFDIDEMEKNVAKFYEILDDVDGSTEDEDFNKEEYLISRALQFDGKICKTYHWDILGDILGDTLKSPEAYKLVREHPKISDHFFRLKNSDLGVESGTYPHELKSVYTSAKKNVAKLVGNVKMGNYKSLARKTQKNKLHVIGYKMQYVNNEAVLRPNLKDPYQTLRPSTKTTKKTRSSVQVDGQRIQNGKHILVTDTDIKRTGKKRGRKPNA